MAKGIRFNRRMDLIGKVFGKLTIIDVGPFLPNQQRRSMWLCKCDCGNEVNLKETQILQGTVSCGCLRGQHVKAHLPEITHLRDRWGKSLVWRYYQYKKGAESRNYSWNLDEILFDSLIQENCFYCGCTPKNVTSVSKRDKNPRRANPRKYNGIDRVDNSRGYEPDNVVACCSDCNRAKRCLSQDAFFNLIKAIYERHLVPRVQIA